MAGHVTRRFRDNPAWVNRAIAKNVERIQDQAPAEWLPHFETARTTPRGDLLVEIEEYGCGAYGCVMPTQDDAVVMKITTDATEARFVEVAMAWGWPEGITHYFGILPLEGKFTIKRRTSEAWMLWRESATDVGKIGSRERLAVDARFPDRHAAMPTILAVYDTGSRIVSALGAEHAPSRRDRNAATSLWAQVNALSIRGSTFIDDLEDIADRMPGAELEVYVQGYRAAIRDLRNYEATGPIGDALCFYLDQHSLIMGDLHVGNFGVVEHTPREPVWAITDPGHVLSVA